MLPGRSSWSKVFRASGSESVGGTNVVDHRLETLPTNRQLTPPCLSCRQPQPPPTLLERGPPSSRQSQWVLWGVQTSREENRYLARLAHSVWMIVQCLSVDLQILPLVCISLFFPIPCPNHLLRLICGRCSDQ